MRRLSLGGWLMSASLGALAPLSGFGTETLAFDSFGTVTIYRPAAPPRELVLFLSGDGGWSLGVVSMAQHLADQGAIVAGIDIRHYLAHLEKSSESCVSPAEELKKLGSDLNAALKLPQPIEPTLVGFSSGATLVYAALAEASEPAFKGALSLGFCPDLDLLKPVCKGAGIESTPRHNAKGVLKGVDFLPAKTLSGKWVSLQGALDQVCPAPAAQQFIAAVPGGEAVLLPKVGHGYSVEKNWVPQFERAFERVTH
jgi:type IV secretory pathway VirJ component